MTVFIKAIRPAALASLLALGLMPASYAQTDANLFASHDKNGDGLLSIEDSEYLEVAIRMLDKDKSDSINQAEFKPFTEHFSVTLEDPFFLVPSDEQQALVDSGDLSHPKIMDSSVLIVDFSNVGKIRYKIEGAQPEAKPSTGTDFDSFRVQFAPPREADITFG